MHGQWDWMNDPEIHSSTLGLGHGLDQGGVEALPQLHPPHLHEHPRQGQGPRLRDHADRPAPEVAPGLPAAAGLQPAADGAVRVGRRLPRPGPRGDARRREVAEGGAEELKGIAGKARLQIQKDYIAWPLLSGLAMAALDVALNARELGAASAGRPARAGVASRLGRVRTRARRARSSQRRAGDRRRERRARRSARR